MYSVYKIIDNENSYVEHIPLNNNGLSEISNIYAPNNSNIPHEKIEEHSYCTTFECGHQELIEKLKDENRKLKKQVANLLLEKSKNKKESKLVNINRTCEKNTTTVKTLSETALSSDKKCRFYTNISSVSLFNELHEVIKPLVHYRFNVWNTRIKVTSTPLKKKHSNMSNKKQAKPSTPKKRGPNRKLSSKDEFLMVLVKLRLGLLFGDLADRFDISVGAASKIFGSWIRAMSLSLKSLIFMPEQERVRENLPSKFKKMPDLMGIIDCSEIFLETPKDLELQSVTWSDYKHHNTAKFLISVTPGSFINFISQPYTGRISDKAITVDCNFLDIVPPHTRIMADKGFNIFQECAAKSIYLTVPPGKRGTSQMTPSEVKKTSQIAKLRILVEQVIRRVKTFRIIANELPISMLPHLNDILVVCAALSNLKNPIMTN